MQVGAISVNSAVWRRPLVIYLNSLHDVFGAQRVLVERRRPARPRPWIGLDPAWWSKKEGTAAVRAESSTGDVSSVLGGQVSDGVSDALG
jgi:hypothetical protein